MEKNTGRIKEAEQMTDKAAVRRQMLAHRDGLSDVWRREAGAEIMDRLTALSCYQEAQAVLCYASYRSEVETDGLIKQALQEQKAVYCPKVISGSRLSQMEFYRIFSLTDLESGFRGIREPKPLPERQFILSGEFIRGAFGDFPRILLIMPGAAFDRENHRIGYGGGFYDRYLERIRQAGIWDNVMTAAVAFSEQIVKSIPTEQHDVIPRLVITEEGVQTV